MLVLQIVTGVLLTLIYTNSTREAFSSLHLGLVNYSYAFFLNSLHLRGASLFFLVMYLHLLKALTLKRYLLAGPWHTGVTLLLLSIAVAFIGYVLPFGRISF
ncbi:MAG: hypothetical protein GY740_01625 [Gammaproteobacteria bacterium]|nr:hypothetical protein [Gammaproteobacteria bacterium]